MSDLENESELSDIELTAEELAEAEASMAARRATAKQTGDILIDLDLESEKTKVIFAFRLFLPLFRAKNTWIQVNSALKCYEAILASRTLILQSQK